MVVSGSTGVVSSDLERLDTWGQIFQVDLHFYARSI